ncbi:MAG: hypothetical protein ABUL73_00940 [Alphaproteobacteria bacterium]
MSGNFIFEAAKRKAEPEEGRLKGILWGFGIVFAAYFLLSQFDTSNTHRAVLPDVAVSGGG